jgi:PQQ-like domain
VFVTGTSKGMTSGRDYATVAYAAATGTQLWVSRYNRHGRSADTAVAIAVSPRGGAVFVTGTSVGGNTGSDFATVAYAARTGATLWTKRYDNAHELDGASSVAVSPDGRRVFVTGGSRGRKFGADFATVAYAAATGAPLWARRYHAPGDRNDTPGKVLVSPRGGGTVVVSGDSSAGGNVSVAYSAVTGRTMWVSRFHQNGFQQEFLAADAISPDGRNFYLTGLGFVVPGGEEPATAFTVAAKVATGAQSWVEVIPPTSGTDTFGVSGAVSPDGGTVYVLVAEFTAGSSVADFTTIAFRT